MPLLFSDIFNNTHCYEEAKPQTVLNNCVRYPTHSRVREGYLTTKARLLNNYGVSVWKGLVVKSLTLVRKGYLAGKVRLLNNGVLDLKSL